MRCTLECKRRTAPGKRILQEPGPPRSMNGEDMGIRSRHPFVPVLTRSSRPSPSGRMPSASPLAGERRPGWSEGCESTCGLAGT